MLKICVIAGTFSWMLPATDFTLAWTHSVEKVRWEEDYRLEGRELVLRSARIRGSAAGMEPPPDAVLRDGVWHYTPTASKAPRLNLANSSFGGSYSICVAGKCEMLPTNAGDSRVSTVIEPCEGGS